ncbi:hypothetical protein F9K91_21215 [Brucella tritici]|uniref:N-acetylmuramoyl-L-alanine amidase n=1 Tax=Brucella tritici TaxID=94626 RepID=A0A7X6J9T2_9HYPH|nr:N-acetylmuramoyl-L-alanine amidase [Brucella tritici]KAB2662758.1 hypothetical protein F9K91_21215 [Brucella tritici]NKW09119.1 hypothetical protein [Brucella tritici]
MTSQLKYKPRDETNRIVIHDSHTSPDITALEDVPRWTELANEGSLKMGLLSIGYHFIIERDGETVECRKRELIGSHAPGHNMDSIGICLVGGRAADGINPEDNFTAAQKHSLMVLIRDLKEQFGPLEIFGHTEIQRYRQRNKPDCPFLDMDILREDIALFEQGIEL